MLLIALSNRIDKLAEYMAKFLGVADVAGIPDEDKRGFLPETRRVMIVHRSGSEYLKYAIARNKGICANLAFKNSVTAFFYELVDEVPDAERPGVLLDETKIYDYLYRKYLKKFKAHSPGRCSEKNVSDACDGASCAIPSGAEPEDFAISRAEVFARQLMQYIYHCRPDQIDFEKNIYPPGRFGKEIAEIVSHYRKKGVRAVLPHAWISGDDADKYFGRLAIPKFLFIFDPAALTPFEESFLRRVLKDKSKFVLISAFSPIEGYWIDGIGKNGCSEDCDPINSENGLDVSFNGRRIAWDVSRSLIGNLWAHCDGNERKFEIFSFAPVAPEDALSDADAEVEYPSANLEIVQSCMICPERYKVVFDASGDGSEFSDCRDNLSGDDKIDDAEGLIPSRDCSSIILRIYAQVRDEAAAVADRIAEIVSASRRNCGQALIDYDDICILIPASACETYAAAFSSSLTERGIPFNIKHIVKHPSSACYSAFEAFVDFLTRSDRRAAVLNFAFHEAIAGEDDLSESEPFVGMLQRLGVYGGSDSAFDWMQGLDRIVDLSIGANSISDLRLEPAIADDGEARLFLRQSSRIGAMLADRRKTRSYRFSYSQWRTYFAELFDAWLRPDVFDREKCMTAICAEMHKRWLSDDETDPGRQNITFDEVAPFLRLIVQKLNRPDESSIFGGVQLRRMDEAAMTCRAVFIVGQTRDAFPSQQVRAQEFERYSPAQMDGYAWNKWFLNATDFLWVSAALMTAEIQKIDDNISPFMRGLRYVFGRKNKADGKFSGIDLLMPEAAQDEEQSGDVISLLLPKETKRAELWQDIKNDLKEMVENDNDAAAPPADLCDIKDPETRKNMRRVLDSAFLDPESDIDYSNTLADDAKDGADPLPKLSWKALAELFIEPNKTIRKYAFDIDEYNDYIDADSQDFLKSLQYPPTQPYAYAYEAASCVDNLLRNCFLTNRLDKFEVYYDCAAHLLQLQGMFPAGIFAERLRHFALVRRGVFEARMSKELGGWNGRNVARFFRIFLKKHRPSVTKYQKWMNKTFFDPASDRCIAIEIDYERDILANAGKYGLHLPQAVFTGELNPIFSCGGKTYVIDKKTNKSNDQRKQHLSFVTILFARLLADNLTEKCCDLTVPTMMLNWKTAIADAGKDSKGLICDLCATFPRLYDVKPDDALNWLYNFYISAKHELNNYTDKVPSKKANTTSTTPEPTVKATKLSSDYNEGARDSVSETFWNAMLHPSEPMPGMLREFALTLSEREKLPKEKPE